MPQESQCTARLSRPARAAQILSLGLLVGLMASGADLLLGSPALGMADNGDFWRVTSAAGLQSPVSVSAVRHRFIQQHYRRATPSPDARFSTAGLLARWAAGMPGGDPGRFALQCMGALLLGLAAALLTYGALQGRTAMYCAGIAWVLVDPAYLLFFNSFYADGAALLGLVGITVVLCGSCRQVSASGMWLLLLCTFVAAWSKQAHAVLGLVVGIAAWLLLMGPMGACARGKATVVVCALIFASSVQHFTFGAGHRFPQINNHNAVFVGIAQVANRPAQTLRRLGIGDEHADRIGVSYFARPVEPALARDLEGLSRARLAWLYASDPVALGRVLHRAQQALTVEDRFLGNYAYSQRDPVARIHAVPWAFSGVRERLLHFPIVGWLWWLGSGAVALHIGRRNRWAAGPWVAAFALWLTVLVETAVAILGDGFFSLARHLLVARFANDLLLVVALVAGLQWALRPRHISTAAQDAIS